MTIKFANYPQKIAIPYQAQNRSRRGRANPRPELSGRGFARAEEKTASPDESAYFSFTLLAISMSFGFSPIMVQITA